MLHGPRRIALVLLAALPALLALPAAGASLVFEDGFDAEPGAGDGASGESSIDEATFASWSVSDGTVDLVASGDFGIACLGGVGKCLDLDGGSDDAGVLESVEIMLSPGPHVLEYALAGTEASFADPAAAEPNVVDVSVEDGSGTSLLEETVTREQGDPFEAEEGAFALAEPATVRIAFANRGGDNFGAILDDVRLRAVPEPGTSLLLGGGVLALGLGGHRRGGAPARRRG